MFLEPTFKASEGASIGSWYRTGSKRVRQRLINLSPEACLFFSTLTVKWVNEVRVNSLLWTNLPYSVDDCMYAIDAYRWMDRQVDNDTVQCCMINKVFSALLTVPLPNVELLS